MYFPGCLDPGYLQNTQRDPSEAQIFYAGQSVHYQCIAGFETLSGSNNKTCDLSGVWTGDNLLCTTSERYWI